MEKFEESSLPFSRWINWVPKRLVSRGAGTRVQVSGSQTSAFFCPWSSSPPSVNLGQIRPLVALLNSRNLPFLTYTQPCCLRKLVINFFFSGNALLPSLQNNVFIIAKPFPSLRRKCIPHDSPKLSCPGLQIQYVNSFVNIYSGWQLRETCGIN